MTAILATLVVACASAPLDAAPGNGWQQMIKRDLPRPFLRSPEDVARYIDDGNGSFAQANVTTVWQGADRSGEDLDSLFNLGYDFSGGWAATDNGVLAWWVSGGRPLGESRDSDLSRAVGSTLGVNGTLINEDLDLKELYWAQALADDLRWSVGLIDSSWRYDFNDTANSTRERFLSPALENSPTIPFPDRSFALDLLWNLSPGFDLHAGLYQSNCGDNSTYCLDDLSSDQWFTPLELSWHNETEKRGKGTYKLLAFWNRRGENEGGGLSLNLEHRFGNVIPFARLSWSDSSVADFDRFASAGVTFSGPARRTHDALGIGVAAGRPSDRNKRTETLFETYWRFQLNPFVALSPSVQLVFDPADNPTANRVLLGALRLQLDF